MAEQALAVPPKVSFNHVFSEVKRESELLMLSKMLKSSNAKAAITS